MGLVGVLAAQATASAQATPPINVGDAAPVAERQGLLGTYYRFTEAEPPGSPPGSPAVPNATTATLLGQQLEPTVNRDFVATVGANTILAGNSNKFMVVYTGRVVIATNETYTFFTASDDGERTWLVDTTTAAPTYGNWVQRGVVEDASAGIALTIGDTPVRIDFEQGNGGAACYFRWQTATITKAIVPAASLRPPAGPAAPTLAASSPPSAPPAQVTLTWNQPAGATGYILSRNNLVLAVINSGATLQYVDNAVTFGTPYNYIIQATSNSSVSIGPASNTANVTPTMPPVTVAPNTGLFTSEAPTSTNATITFNQALTAGQSVDFTIQSNDAGEGVVSSSGQGPAGTIMFTVNGPVAVNATVTLTITGVDDAVADGPQAYQVSVTTAGQFGAVAIPPLQVTNNDNDTPGITFSQTAGLVTSETLTSDPFTVTLNTQPTANVTMSLLSSDTLEATVSPASLTFTPTFNQAYDPATGVGGWNVPHTVTVTGVDDALLDFTMPYTIVTGNLGSTDANYGAMATPDVSGQNLDNEVIPPAPSAWGNCGFLGVEVLLGLALAAGLRRRAARRAV